MTAINWQPPEQNVDWLLWEELVEDGYDEAEAFRRATTLRFPLTLGGTTPDPQPDGASAATPVPPRPLPHHSLEEEG